MGEGAESVFLCIATIKGQSDTRALTHVHCCSPHFPTLPCQFPINSVFSCITVNANIVHSWTVHWLHLVFVPVVFLQFNFCLLGFMNSWHKFYSKFSERAINSHPVQPFTQIIYQSNFFFLEPICCPAPTGAACTHFNFHVVIRRAFQAQLRLFSVSWILTSFFFCTGPLSEICQKGYCGSQLLKTLYIWKLYPTLPFHASGLKSDVGNRLHTDIKDIDQLSSDFLCCCESLSPFRFLISLGAHSFIYPTSAHRRGFHLICIAIGFIFSLPSLQMACQPVLWVLSQLAFWCLVGGGLEGFPFTTYT